MSERAIKQVILYRRDLKMRKGKIAAQVAHASMAAVLRTGTWTQTPGETGEGIFELKMPNPMSRWLQGRFAKIVLSVESEDDLLAAQKAAEVAGIPNALITDSGKTEFGGVPTRTTLALGPDYADRIDPISGRDGLILTKLA